MEWAWKSTKKFRTFDEKRDGKYPAFRRIDAKNWAKWKFYPGAVFMFLTRIILLTILGGGLCVFISVLTFGHDFRKLGPLKNGKIKRIIHAMYKYVCIGYIFVCGVSTDIKRHDNVKYTKYLGPNYSEGEYASTIVCNHVSWLDPIVLIKTILPAFSPTSGLCTIPLLATLMDCLDSIYIPRGGT